MKHILSTMLLLIMAAACRKEEKAETAAEAQAQSVPPPQALRLGAAYEAELNRWAAFKNLETEIKRFQEVQPQEYELMVADLLRLERELAVGALPEKFNIPAIRSRITVFKTYLLQTKWLQNASRVSDTTMGNQKAKVIEAFNALKKQLGETLATETAQELLKGIEE